MKQIPVFLVGVLVYHVMKAGSDDLPKKWLEVAACVVVALILLAGFLPFVGGLYPISALFGALAFVLSRGAGTWLTSPAVCAIGVVSYSSYLMHFAVLGILRHLLERGIDPLEVADQSNGALYFIVFYMGVVGVTVALSAVTYRYVEKPGIAVGRWVAKRLFRATDAPQASVR